MNTSENQRPPGLKRGENPRSAESRVQVNGVHADHMADKAQKWDKVEDTVDESICAIDSSVRH